MAARIGITLMTADTVMRPDRLAVEVESRGFESLFVPEHSHIPISRDSPWPGSLTGEPLPTEYSHLHDATVALAMAAARTERILLGTSVSLIAQRDALWTAKELATLDYLSDGRLIVGVGFGWNREEMANHGTPFARRWAITREKVEAMRALWREDEAEYHGEYVDFGPSWAWPKPAQPGGPKVVLGGGAGPRLLGEVATWADGWMPISRRNSLAERLALLDQACERVGRDRATVEISVFGATTDATGLANLFEEGIHRAVLTLPIAGDDEVLRALDEWAGLLDQV
jgi:probable F420-dependent oxidoreductase